MALGELQNLEKTVRKKKSRKKLWVALILLLLLLLLIGGAVFFWRMPRPVSQFELDRNALEGFLPGRTKEEIQAELNRIIDKSRFNVSINPTPVVGTDGMVNLMIENVPANNYLMKVDVYYTDQNNEQKLLYASGLIKQGFYIESVKVEENIPPVGEYNGIAEFRALHPETMEEIGTTAANILIKVEG